MEVSQKFQNKTDFKERDNKADIAGTIRELSGQIIPESEDYHKFIRNISMPRDDEYVQLIAEQIELLYKKEALLAELAEIGTEQEPQPEEKMSKEGALEASQEKNADAKKQKTMQAQAAQTIKEAKTPSKEEVRKKELEAELKRLDEEAAFLKKNLEEMFPESRRMQCMIYPLFREGELICAGVINGRGRSYHGEEELCDIVKPETKRERAMLQLGNSILTEELDQVLNIEIYPEAVCVVYPNGLTKVYR